MQLGRCIPVGESYWGNRTIVYYNVRQGQRTVPLKVQEMLDIKINGFRLVSNYKVQEMIDIKISGLRSRN
jgi:hypothetical protein